jgi:HD superfamily phosphohydrolase
MGMAIGVIRSKGHEITPEEAEAVTIAILLHDIGHGPFSHSLEHVLAQGTSHEHISLLYMEQLDQEFGGRLSLAIQVFRNEHPKYFLHQLVSSQLDMDRLDYLKRDSYFTGVTEGVVGSDRIIKMLNVKEGQLVVEAKGIYSIEKFLIARRLMYWQVYLHRTVVGAEQLLIMTLRRARDLSAGGMSLFAPPALQWFLGEGRGKGPQSHPLDFLKHFAMLDDNDVLSSAKVWSNSDDKVLSLLAGGLVNRRLFAVELSDEAFSPERVDALRKEVSQTWKLSAEEASYLVISDSVSNFAYSDADERIQVMDKDGHTRDIAEASDVLNISVLSKTVRKYFLCYPGKLKKTEQTD